MKICPENPVSLKSDKNIWLFMWSPKSILFCLATLNRDLRETWYFTIRISREHQNLAKIWHFTWRAKYVLSFPLTLSHHDSTLFPRIGIWLLGGRQSWRIKRTRYILTSHVHCLSCCLMYALKRVSLVLAVPFLSLSKERSK